MKRTLVSGLIFGAVLVMMLLLSEWIVRMIYADETVLFPRYHTDVQYGDYTIRRIRPNASFRHTSRDGSWEFVTNSQGFRNREDFEYEKPVGMLRVLSLGDSHTQGYEVRQEHTFSAVLQRYLARHSIQAQVMNAGVSGFSTAEALILLENEGVKFDPDIVVLGFYANDLEDNIKSALFSLDEKGALIEAKKHHTPGVRIQNIIYSVPGAKWLGENSYFYSLLFNTTWDFFKSRMARKARERVVEFAVPQRDRYSNYELELTAALLERLYQVCVHNNIKLVIVDIPRQVADDAVRSSFPEELRHMAIALSDAFVDSLALFDEYAGVAELHVPHGSRHVSEFSHTLIGVAVGREIAAFNTSVRSP